MATLTTAADGADRAIVRRAVARLRDRLPELAGRLVGEILSGEGGDRPSGPREDLWEVCHTGLDHGFAAILDPGRGRADLEWAEELGRRRAEQGLPLDRLLRSYRLAGCVFWDALVEAVTEDDPAQVPALVRQATRTWQTIDQQSSTAAAAYHRTEYDLLRRSEERVNAVVDALLEGRGDGGLVATACSVLGLAPSGRYAVVMLRQDEPLERATGRPADSVAAGGMRFIWRVRADVQVAVVDLGEADLDDLVDALRPHVRAYAGVSAVVDGLADLGAARWMAELALRTCRPPEPDVARIDRRLPDALLASQPALADRLHAQVLGPLARLDAATREVLLSTLTAWLECDGSAARAASRLYCHHNTVLNRLRRIEKLTGRLLSRPRDLVEVVLALSAHRLTDDRQ
ncbi:PucR family transcriptional regulator [Actinomadura rubrobrunea]|uniref:PucR family transcriptional regulator n=1 Tax=Actinomadura rubrobrunea TaxID=115335 RepID=A0A9W6PXK3_9ACTN|nr:helix-turn-helix domain-containing protein [Actinomadura rubrobrunea]GLW64821.1 PucR family transcriptional regulator [Actinomadura rubrobrunea]